ncbi:MAG: M20/M25/M40 family metallo-hydrolase [Prevotellaceae bacterium]|jgi:hypothetical protein|nr:M20/M25/M40 family metallo-hydrolase [Prevotellaceae bacterium]
MIKRYLFTILNILVFATLTFAQKEKGLEVINKRGIEAHLAFLASDALEGREAGKNSGRVAAEYIKAVLLETGVKPFYDSYFQHFEAYSPAREKEKDFQVNPDSIALYKQERAYRRLNLQNVLGYIEGEKKDEYVIIGAHYDHVGIDELLVGDRIYNGADDNASSVAAVLQVVKGYAATGNKPARSIIFAFWDGEEVNYLGSEYFVENFKKLESIVAYINLDMIGREGFLPVFYPQFKIPKVKESTTAQDKTFYQLYTRELEKASNQLVKDANTYKLDVVAKPSVIEHKSRGSDNLPFSLRSVPILWFFTGLHPDYHTPVDETETINFDNLTNITKVVYLSLWNLSQ